MSIFKNQFLIDAVTAVVVYLIIGYEPRSELIDSFRGWGFYRRKSIVGNRKKFEMKLSRGKIRTIRHSLTELYHWNGIVYHDSCIVSLNLRLY